jgi:hypothetical protein
LALRGAPPDRLQHFTSPAKKPSVSLVVGVCATGLADAVTYTKGAFESEAFAAAAASVLDESLTPPLTKACPFLEKEDPEQVRREAQRAAAFEAKMEADRQLLEERRLAKDAVTNTEVTKAALMELLGEPTPRKERGAQRW